MHKDLPIFHAVSLRQSRARRVEAASPASAHEPQPDFEDTVPLWFRSEAFAEDITQDDAAEAAPSGGTLRRMDTHVLNAGEAVLRLTLGALRPQRGPYASQAPQPRHSAGPPRRASGWV